MRRHHDGSRRPGLPLLITLGALGAFGPLSIDMYLPALPRIAEDLEAQSWLVQMSLSACLLGLASGQLIVGPLSDRHGRVPILMAGLVAYVIISGLCVVAPTAEILVALRLAQGLAGSVGIVLGRAITRDLYEGRDLSRIFSRLLLVTMVAPVVAPILGGQILHVTDWRGTFVALAIIGAAILAAAVAFVPETLPPERRTNHHVRDDLMVYGQMLRSTNFRPYAIVVSLFGAVLFAFIAGSPFVVQDVYGYSPVVFSLVFAGVSAATIIAGQVSAQLVDRHSPARLLRIGAGVAAAGSTAVLGVAVAGTGVGFGLFVVVLAVAVAPNGVVTPNASALAMEGYGANAGSAAALLGLATFLLGGVTSPLVGIAGNRSVTPMAIIMFMASAVAFGLLLARRIGAPERPVP